MKPIDKASSEQSELIDNYGPIGIKAVAAACAAGTSAKARPASPRTESPLSRPGIRSLDDE
ncbi:hypothetical protein FS834_26465 [Agrobacterium vitis]|nr:hypothetical protein [Allorhizobium ampelinum]MCF1450315.1 hypothetical protein [Allorhizobium ampelinum]MCF1495998.1 hypothetical protein [Allorhizobium ampelinum]